MKLRLKKDIVIPAGTVFSDAPTSKLTGVVAKPDLSITQADRGYNVRVECEVRP